MITFEWWWAFAFLPLPLVVRFLARAAETDRDCALLTPFIEDFEAVCATNAVPAAAGSALWLAALAWICLVTATARPQWIGDPVALPVTGRDLMLAVDLSGSMEVEDFEVDGQLVNRLLATKKVAGEFIQRREGDRLGLILFGRNAYLQTPLTFDRDTVYQLLMESAIGLAGKETAIGDAIGLAVKRLRDNTVESRILILLTDGANTAGAVTPVKAAELAAQTGLKIYTIGIGADEMLVQSLFGMRRVNPSRDLDETALTAIAKATGGRYFRARNTVELEQIYALLDELEPIETEAQQFRPTRALFHWPLALALSLAAVLLLARARGR